MPAANVIQLQALLAEKFPGLRLGLDGRHALKNRAWPTGLPQLDEPLRGGLPRGALSEIAAPGNCSGSATLLGQLLDRAAEQGGVAALIDGMDSLDVTQLDESVLSRLLWVRCHGADEALKAADLILRDGNLPIVLLDLKSNPATQLGRIPATTWYRFQYLLEETATVCAVFTPRPMVAPARARVTLHARFAFDALERDTADLLRDLEVEVAGPRATRESLQNTA
jgi:hypothetical protein